MRRRRNGRSGQRDNDGTASGRSARDHRGQAHGSGHDHWHAIVSRTDGGARSDGQRSIPER
ncbi:hypothetical protein ACQUFE_17760, partial [Enterococcus casseliflavus]|uniref:hypothetical protein n=1 Tax=Enterococcus casseliflavus TaxID=37734 RepID=UPI003D10F4E4